MKIKDCKQIGIMTFGFGIIVATITSFTISTVSVLNDVIDYDTWKTFTTSCVGVFVLGALILSSGFILFIREYYNSFIRSE